MGIRSLGITFPRLAIAGAVGVYAALVLIGLERIVTGQMFAHFGQWALMCVPAAMLGAAAGAVYAAIAYRRLPLPQRRIGRCALIGAVTLPLVLTFDVGGGDLSTAESFLLLFAWMITASVYIRRLADARDARIHTEQPAPSTRR